MPVKKTAKNTVAKKPVVKAAPVVEHKCECGEHCHCHGRAHWLKHVIILALVFALGMVCGKMLPGGHHHRQMPKTHPVFVNGCLDVQSVTNKRLQEKLATADADSNACISVEEYRAARKELFPSNLNKGPRGPIPQKAK